MASAADQSKSGDKFSFIQNVKAGQKSVNLNFIVLEVGAPRQTNNGYTLRLVKVADGSGCANLCLWNETGEHVFPGDIFRLRNGHTTVYKGSVSISCGKSAELLKTGEFTMVFAEQPNMSDVNADLLQSFPPPGKRSPSAHTDGGGGGARPPPSKLARTAADNASSTDKPAAPTQQSTPGDSARLNSWRRPLAGQQRGARQTAPSLGKRTHAVANNHTAYHSNHSAPHSSSSSSAQFSGPLF